MQFDRTQLAWTLLGIALGVGLVVVLHAFFGTLLFALFVYYAARPVYRRMNRHVDHLDLAATATLLVFALPALAVAVYTLWVGLQGLVALLHFARLVFPRLIRQGFVELPLSILFVCGHASRTLMDRDSCAGRIETSVWRACCFPPTGGRLRVPLLLGNLRPKTCSSCSVTSRPIPSRPTRRRSPPEATVEIVPVGDPDGCSGKANALAVGLEHASDDLIVLTDDDVERDADWLARLKRLARRHGAASATPAFVSPHPRWHPFEPVMMTPSIGNHEISRLVR